MRSLKGSTTMPSYVYILSSQRNGTLYVGSASDLIKRVWEHKSNVIPSSFTAQYKYLVTIAG
jgi:putative endonuclease